MENLEAEICRITRSTTCQMGSIIQALWSGYGVIQKAQIDDQPVVVKHIDLSTARSNRRGWKSDFAHQRKVFSYKVESHFYRDYSDRCAKRCRLPKLHGEHADEDYQEMILVLEDLDAAGFAVRKSEPNRADIYSCLRWLANFHSVYLQTYPSDLWPVGTYWHLETRPNEFQAMEPSALKDFAKEIDTKLNRAEFKTLVHGDAKVANFCFSNENRASVAAVDFQYVGGGVGIKDVAYFLSSCMFDHELAEQEGELLSFYFKELSIALGNLNSNLNFEALETEWRSLYPFAWADFCRFLSGWSPDHWKLNTYSNRLTNQVIETLS